MARKIAVNLDLLGNEIKNFVVDATSTAPAAKQGAFYYDITAKALKYHNGTAWITVATGGDASQIADDLTALTLRVDGHDTSIAALQTIVQTAATTSAMGMMSAADKTKLDGIATGAQVNQNAFSKIKVGTTTVEADNATDTVELVGSNITLTPDATNDKVTIALPTASSSQLGGVKVGSRLSISGGVLSANVQSDTNFTQAEKTKLAGIATGANNYTLPEATSTTLGGVKVDTTLSDSSTSPVQNKAVKAYVDTLEEDLTSRINDLDTAAANIANKVDTVTGENAITSTVTSTSGDPVVKTAKVALKLDNSGNVTLSQSASGLKAVAPEYTVEALATAETGYLKTYRLKKGSSYVGASINIPKDFLVKSGSVVSGTWSGTTFTESTTGKDKALKLVIYTKDSSTASDTIYINVKDLVDVYTAGNGILISDNNKVSINSGNAAQYIDVPDPDDIDSGSTTLDLAIESLTAKAGVQSVGSLKGDILLDTGAGGANGTVQFAVNSTNKTISATVRGLKSAATYDASSFATASQGTKADSAVQNATGDTYVSATKGSNNIVSLAATDTLKNAVTKADNSVQYTDTAKTQVTIPDKLTVADGHIHLGDGTNVPNIDIDVYDDSSSNTRKLNFSDEDGASIILSGLESPENIDEAANKQYVDTTVSSGINALDSEKSGSDSNSQVTVKVSQTDGKLSGVTVTTNTQYATADEMNVCVNNKLKEKSVTASATGTFSLNAAQVGDDTVIPSSIRTFLVSGGVYTEFIGDISSGSLNDGGWPYWTISWNGLSVSSGDTIKIYYAVAF